MNLKLAVYALMLSTTTCFAYPHFPGQNPSDFVREQTKPPFVLYQAPKDKVFQGYGPKKASDTLTDYDRPRKGSVLSDFEQRSRNKESYRLYHRVERTYEKQPRFRY